MNRSFSPSDSLSITNVLIFDMDGVLIDSNRMRDDAFVHIFEAIRCEERDEILSIHRNNRGLYRKDKISLIYEHFFGSPPSPDLLNRLTESFSQYVREHISSCPLTPGVIEFLEAYCEGDLFVVSAADEKEVLWVTKSLGIARFFKGIYGGPTRKSEWFRRIIASYSHNPLKVTFVGDQISDFKAAKEVGLNFIAFGKGDYSFPSTVLYFEKFHDLFLFLTGGKAKK